MWSDYRRRITGKGLRDDYRQTSYCEDHVSPGFFFFKKKSTKTALKLKLYILILKLLHTAFHTKYSESRYRSMSSCCYQMWNHYTKCKKKKTKHMQWLDKDILCKTYVDFTYTVGRRETDYCTGVWKRNWYKMWCNKYKKFGFDDERLKTLYRSLYCTSYWTGLLLYHYVFI